MLKKKLFLGLVALIILIPINAKFYFVTGNKGKLSEVSSVFKKLGIPIEQGVYPDGRTIDLTEIQEIDPKKVIEAKLKEAANMPQFKGHSLLIEDTSLYFDALASKKGTLPGPFIKWFSDTIGNDGLVKITQCFGNANATAKCIMGYMDALGKILYFDGSVDGTIVSPRSKGQGFGWDPIFEPKEQKNDPKLTFAEMSQDEKNSYSMRGQAANKVAAYLQEEGLLKYSKK